MQKIKFLIIPLVLLVFSACSEESTTEYSEGGELAKYTISGKVTDQNGTGLADANVSAKDNNSIGIAPAASVTTSSDGSYSFQLDEGGNYDIRVFYTDHLNPDDSKTIDKLNSNMTINFVITIP